MNQEVKDTMILMFITSKTVEEGDCILWTGCITSNGHPMTRRQGNTLLVRREVFRLCCGDLIARIPIDTRCGNKNCVNPEHLCASTASNIAKKAAKRGAWTTVARSVKISNAKRTKSKLTIEQAREIRASTESGPVLALRYGVNRSLINGIKRGSVWKDYSNPFMGLIWKIAA